MKIAVIGTGLIGTSIALALRAHDATVWLADADPAAARLAADLGAGEPLPETPTEPADIAVIAVPPAAVAATLAKAQTQGPGPLLHRRGQRQAAARGPGQRAAAAT